jgi:antitoxin ParD1/3/4
MSQSIKAERITITLPPEMLALLKTTIKAGEYGSISEVIRDAIRVWQRKEEERQARLELIRVRLEQSVNSGEPIPLEDVFVDIEQLHQSTMNADDYEAV